MKKRYAWFMLLVLAALANSSGFRAAAPQQRLITIDIRQKSPLEALIAVGEQARIPLGIFCSDNQLLQGNITAQYQGSEISAVLSGITSKVKGYSLLQDSNGVYVVQKTDALALSAQILTPLGRFRSMTSESATTVSFELWGTLQGMLDRTRTGYGGILHTPAADDRRLPVADLQDATVPKVLSWIITQRKGMAWVIWPPPDDIRKVPQYRLWNFLFYSDESSDGTVSSECCLYVPKDIPAIDPGLRRRFPTP